MTSCAARGLGFLAGLSAVLGRNNIRNSCTSTPSQARHISQNSLVLSSKLPMCCTIYEWVNGATQVN